MKNLITTSKTIAISSFIIGTILFVIELYTNNLSLIMVGVYFIIIAAIINTISLIALIFNSLRKNGHQFELIKTCGLVLLNIPIVLLYLCILLTVQLNSMNPNW